jgi:ketosteroid isomerase-like protein
MTTTSTEQQVRELGERWVRAETDADVAALDALSTADFTLVGPLGFVLDKGQWLHRYRSGDLATEHLVWDEVAVRDYGGAAVAVGRNTQRASYRGTPANGSFRATHVLVRAADGWRLAGIQLSPIGGPPPFTPPAGGAS